MKMYEVEERYVDRDLSDPEVRGAARRDILRVIEEYRSP
jgi:hypothetical protein